MHTRGTNLPFFSCIALIALRARQPYSLSILSISTRWANIAFGSSCSVFTVFTSRTLSTSLALNTLRTVGTIFTRWTLITRWAGYPVFTDRALSTSVALKTLRPLFPV